MPDHSRPFQIEADASKYASGAVLTQTDVNGDRHPVAFISKTFSPTERNYEIYDRELLAIIRALEEWRHYIQGSPHTTVILSDHKNLMYYREAKKLNRRQARWSLYLSESNWCMSREQKWCYRMPFLEDPISALRKTRITQTSWYYPNISS